jgi:hypothetical protein
MKTNEPFSSLLTLEIEKTFVSGVESTATQNRRVSPQGQNKYPCIDFAANAPINTTVREKSAESSAAWAEMFVNEVLTSRTKGTSFRNIAPRKFTD